MADTSLAERPPTGGLSGPALRTAWESLTARSGGKLRARDAARTLGVSEGELVASLVGQRAIRLRTSGAAIIRDVPALGPVMALTRNEHCVHEKIGPYLEVTINGAHALVAGELIDLRIFPSHWRHTFAVVDETTEGPRRSLQIFDADGNFLLQFGSQGNGKGQFERPTDIAISSKDIIYVADWGNHRIQKFRI